MALLSAPFIQFLIVLIIGAIYITKKKEQR